MFYLHDKDQVILIGMIYLIIPDNKHEALKSGDSERDAYAKG